MIKVLHVFSNSDSLTAHYVSALTAAMKEEVESMITNSQKDVRKICRQFLPDIVHLYGNVYFPYEGFRVVKSPNGHPMSDNNCYVVIARSPIEADGLSKQEIRRVEIIRNPLFTKTANFEETAQKMVSVYKKIMDSNPLALMNEATKKALAVILKTGICGDRRWLTTDMPETDSVDFRLLHVYAQLEGVTSIMHNGIKALGITAPSYKEAACYLPHHYRESKSMHGKAIAEMVEDVRVQGISLLRLTDIYTALLNEHLDEEKLVETLESKRLKHLFCSILTVMSEQLMLDEGYMPCQPAENAETRRLRQNLLNHLRL